jgi:hypothetical protein
VNIVTEEYKSFAQFQSAGFLWLINRVVFHPRGFALAFHINDNKEVVGWSLQGDGSEPFVFDNATDDNMFTAVKQNLPS